MITTDDLSDLLTHIGKCGIVQGVITDGHLDFQLVYLNCCTLLPVDSSCLFIPAEQTCPAWLMWMAMAIWTYLPFALRGADQMVQK